MAVEVTGGTYESHTDDGFTVSSNSEKADDIKANFDAEPKPKDGEAPDPEKEEADKVSKAASELGKKGGKAAAEAREKEAKKEAKTEKEEPEAAKIGKPRDDPKARMLEATRKEAEAKRELARERQEREQERRELEQLRRERQTTERPPERKESAKPKGDPRPEEKDFEEYGEFVEARSRWAARQEYNEVRQRESAYRQAAGYAQQVHETVQRFYKGVTEAMPDWQERIAPELQELVPTFILGPEQRPNAGNILADELLTTEHPHGVMLYLTEHPEDLQRIGRLQTPRDIAREIAKIEARVDDGQPVVKGRPLASQAKPPVRPVTGAVNVGDSDEYDEDDSIEAHIRKGNAAEFKKRRSAYGGR